MAIRLSKLQNLHLLQLSFWIYPLIVSTILIPNHGSYRFDIEFYVFLLVLQMVQARVCCPEVPILKASGVVVISGQPCSTSIASFIRHVHEVLRCTPDKKNTNPFPCCLTVNFSLLRKNYQRTINDSRAAVTLSFPSGAGKNAGIRDQKMRWVSETPE
jgi:hypothetical protein